MTDTTRDELVDLREAVDALTLPVKKAHWQGGHEHTWIPCAGKHGSTRCMAAECPLFVCEWCDETTNTPAFSDAPQMVVRREDPPLLDQLAAAVRGDLGQGGNSRSARERTPLDLAALQLLEDIDGRVRSMLDELGARPGKDITPTQCLRSWYALWYGGHHTEGLAERYISILRGWEAQIIDKLAPPRRIEITAPCPVCGQEFVNVGLKLANGEDDPDDIERVRVLNAVERDNLEDCYALCAGCDTVWKGVARMRQLRIMIDDRHAAATSATDEATIA